MSLPVWLAGPMFLLGGGLCLWSHVPPGGGGHLLDRDPLFSKERVLRILLECILVEYLNELILKPPNVTSRGWVCRSGEGEGIPGSMSRGGIIPYDLSHDACDAT